MDHETIAVYDELADTYRATRDAWFVDDAERLAAGAEGVVLDLGCGTGTYLDHLGPSVVGLDASRGMLALAAEHGRPLLCADFGRLPFRREALARVWARNSLLHVAHADLPLVLAELHRSLAVDARVVVSFIPGDDDRYVADDDLPGRNFWRWSDDHLIDVFVGAGFTDVRLDGEQTRFVRARRARTLPDTVGAGMRGLVCGLNPSLHAADAGVGFVTPSNRFWPAAIEAGLASVERDAFRALRDHGLGMTDLVKRATRRADELSADEYRAGLARVHRLCERLQPRAVCMVGLAGWRAAVDRRATAGWQDRTLGGRPVYVMPSTSGLNAHSRMADLVAHLHTAFSTE